MSVEGVALSFLIYTLVLAAAAAVTGRWFLQRQQVAEATCYEHCQWAREEMRRIEYSANHAHEFALPIHDHPHDHPHNHEHLQHTHTLETMSRHEENGRPVFVKYCGICKTVFRDLPEPQAV